ncbi:sulfite exporter TauE/SafE family protein [Corynebacterium timonense]|uniref:Probable membrane transporter protein n=1 Tax=Corynebacterium timonense TaxID=441500 RepID=A0A1H1PPV7_9CORY|nr:sulfite exporter TauE/SafE family protein [Corynebacterium timonense]SDS13134.1 hypothetical protein SAMN04488539_1072 [Corynebacterium timonense]
MTAAVILFCAVLIGSLLQRVSGMGVGLIAGPVLSILIGPVEGIVLVNVLATINAGLTTLTVRGDVDWRRFGSIAPYLVVGAVPGAVLVAVSSADALLVTVGVLLLLALGAVTVGKKRVPTVSGRAPAAASGVIGGFMNTLAGVAGPAITVYAEAARWPQRTYAATLQPIFMVSGAVSFLIKELTGAANVASIGAELWVAGGLGMVLGIAAGVAVAPRVPAPKAHALALGLAVLGGATALVRGLAGLLG